MDVGEATHKGRMSRQRILHCAAARFARDGFAGTTVAQVARDAGLTPPAVHAHFATKADLFAAAFEHDVAGVLLVARHHLLAHDLSQPWTPLVSELVGAIRGHGLVERVFRGLEPERTAGLLELESVRELQDSLSSMLLLGQEEGAVRSDIAASTLGAALTGVLLAFLLASLQIGVVVTEEQRKAMDAILSAGLAAR